MIEIIDTYLSEASQAYDLFSMRADAVMESAMREYLINQEEAELKIMQEHGTYDDMEYYYEEAKNGLIEHVVTTIQRIKEAIIKFFSTMKDKILSVMGKKENREALNKIEKRIKVFPLLGRKKILVEDYDAHMKNSEKALTQLSTVKAKLKSGHDVDPEQIHDIKKSFFEEHGRLIGVSAAVTITVAAGIAAIHKISDKSSATLNRFEKAATDACNDCIEIAKKCDNPAVAHVLAETITTVSKTAQEDAVRVYSGTVSAIKKSIKSFGKTKVDVSKAKEALSDIKESSDNPDTLSEPSSNEANNNSSVAKNIEEYGDDPYTPVEPDDEPDTDPWDDVMQDPLGVDEDDISESVSEFDDVFESFCESLDIDSEDESVKDIFESLMNDISLASGSDEPTYENTYDRLMSEIDSL